MLNYIKFPLRAARWETVAAFVLRVASALLPTVRLLLMAQFVDEAVVELGRGAIEHKLLGIVAAFVSTLLLERVLGILASFVSARFAVLVNAAHELRLVEKKSRVTYATLEDADSYELMCRVIDNQSDRMTRSFNNLMRLAESLLQMLGIAAAVCVKSVWAAVFLLAVYAAVLRIARKCGSESYAAYEDATAYYKVSRYLRGILSGRDYVGERTLFGYTDAVGRLWGEAQENGCARMKRANKKAITNMRLLSSGTVVLATLLYAAMLLPVRAGTMSAGLYISVLSSLMQVLSMLTWNYAAYMEDYESDRLYAEDLKRFLSLPEEAKSGKHFEMPSVRSIIFDDVTFRYPGCEQPTLRHLSFTLEGGRRYGFVGKNGAGKTTVIKLLTGLYSDYEGEIRINGVELREMDDQTRTGLFSTIYQDFARYEVSAWENLTLGCQSKPEQSAVTAILDALGLSERLKELPNGLDTDLGRLNDVGVDFSGGEWQRIAIARSLLRHAPVQIMLNGEYPYGDMLTAEELQTLLDTLSGME